MARMGIAAFAFGEPGTLRSNLAIGKITATQAAICQEAGSEVFVFRQLELPVQVDETIPITEAKENWERRKCANTLIMAIQIVDWAAANKLDKVYVAGADTKPRSHLNRCLRDVRWIAKKRRVTLNILPCSGIDAYGSVDWYRLESLQKRTRFAEAWSDYEAMFDWMPMWLYELLTTRWLRYSLM